MHTFLIFLLCLSLIPTALLLLVFAVMAVIAATDFIVLGKHPFH